MSAPKFTESLLLEVDLMLYDPWTAIKPSTTSDLSVVSFRKTSGHGITLRVYGTIGTSDLTGKPVIEDMKVMLGDADVYNGLPESLLQELTEAAIEDN